MKKILLSIILFSTTLFGEGIVKATYYPSFFGSDEYVEMENKVKEKISLQGIEIADNEKVEIKLEHFIFYVPREDFIQVYNNNKENIRRGIEKLTEVGNKISKEQLKNIYFQETLLELTKQRKILIFNQDSKQFLDTVVLTDGRSSTYYPDKKSFSEFFYDELIYTEDLTHILIKPSWSYHFSTNGDYDAPDKENDSAKLKELKKLYRSAKEHKKEQQIWRYK
ncbi:MAG TPA: hypothetical protein VIG61_05380 [Fusobacterium sp.]|uniref:hypothetical protein n=1 Tax=Fusobacterium sp. TaxID=68766 RepID=UPI002F4162C0